MSTPRSVKIARLSPVTLLLIGNFLYAACQWLLMTSLVKGSSVSLLGFYSYSLSIMAPIIAIGNMGLRSFLARDSNDEYDASDFLRLRVLCFTVAVTFLLVCVGSVSNNRDFLIIIFLIAAAKMAEACSDICYGGMQKLKRGAAHGLSLILRCTFAGLLFSAFWYVSGDIKLGFAGISLAWFFVLFVFDMPQAEIDFRSLLIRVSKGDLGRYLKLAQRSVPIIMTALIGSVLAAVPNYSIEHILGFESLGYYTSFFCFSVAMNLIGTTFGQSALADLSRMYNTGQVSAFYRRIVSDLVYILVAAVALVLIFATWGESILAITFGDKVRSMHSYLPIIFALSIPMFIAQYLSYTVTATAEYASITRVTCVALIVSLILAFPVVNNFGLLGAAALTFLAGGTQVFGFMRALSAAMRARGCEKSVLVD